MKIGKHVVIILIVLLVTLNIYQVMNPKIVYDSGDKDRLLEKIEEHQHKLDSINVSRIDRDKKLSDKLDSIYKQRGGITKDITRTIELEKNEKNALYNDSDDVNLVNFINYIDHYRTNQRTGRDTIR